jgi:hypothetical protein
MKRTLSIVTTSNTSVGLKWRQDFFTAAEAMHYVVPLLSIKFVRAASPTSPPTFTYILTAVDGRVWRQLLTFDQTAPSLGFTQVQGQWRPVEVDAHRAIRTLCIAAYSTGLQSIIWTAE